MSIHYSKQGEIVVLAADNPPVNALSHAVRKGLKDALDRAEADAAQAVVIYGVGRTWFAGADIREFGQAPADPILPELCNRIEAMPVPVIAAMHGTALGGGLEVALSCHYRTLSHCRKGLIFGFTGSVAGPSSWRRRHTANAPTRWL